MLVRHILREKGRDVVTVMPDATLSEAARLLARKRIGALVVRGADGSVKGILSERDIVHAVAEASVSALAHAVSQHMTGSIETCAETDSVDDLMELMTRRRFRHVPVMDGERLAGIVSIGDIVKTHIAETEQEAIALRQYIAAS